MSRIEVTIDEAREIARCMVSRLTQGAFSFDDATADVQTRGLGGIIALVAALQDVGYRISPPLRAVPQPTAVTSLDERARRERCAYCRAPPGAPCVGQYKRPIKGIHAVRRAAVKRLTP